MDRYHFLLESNEWRQLAQTLRRRAGYQCSQCGRRNLPLHLHHRIAVKDDWGKRLDPYNLVVLCQLCHERTHGHCLRGWRAPPEQLPLDL